MLEKGLVGLTHLPGLKWWKPNAWELGPLCLLQPKKEIVGMEINPKKHRGNQEGSMLKGRGFGMTL